MCGKTPKPPPAIVQRDPVAEQRRAEAEGQMKANEETANTRRRRGMAGATVAAVRAANLGGTAGDGPSLLAQAAPGG